MARSKWEIRAGKTLKEDGWKVDYKVRPPFLIRGYSVDYFNLFDILAYKPGLPLRFISVKPKNAPPAHRQAIADFVPEGTFSKELWRFDRDPKNKRRVRCRITVID